MSTWKNDHDGEQPGPVDPAARTIPEIRNTTTFATEGSLALAPDPVPLSTAPAPTVAQPAAALAEAAPTTSDAPESDAADAEQNKVFAVLAYVGILFLVPLLVAPKSRFARYHTNQGIVLFIASMVLSFGFYILAFVPVLGRLMGFVGYLVWLAAFALMILGIVNAANGKCQPLPVIGGYQLLK